MTPVTSKVFERIFVASTLEEQILKSLAKWFPDYLREVEAQLDLRKNSIPPPAVYTNRNSFDAEAGENLPKVVVIAPGTTGDPNQLGGGVYESQWEVGIGVAMAASDEVEANMLVKIYAAVTRAIMLQNSELGTIGVNDIRWVRESYDDLPIPNQIQLYKAAGSYFVVNVQNVVNRFKGPTVPNADPYAYGTVQNVIIQIIKDVIT